MCYFHFDDKGWFTNDVTQKLSLTPPPHRHLIVTFAQIPPPPKSDVTLAKNKNLTKSKGGPLLFFLKIKIQKKSKGPPLLFFLKKNLKK